MKIKQKILTTLLIGLSTINASNLFANTSYKTSTLPAIASTQTEIDIAPNLKLEVQVEEKPDKANPATLEQHFNVFRKEFHKENQRRNQRLKDIKEWTIIDKMELYNQFSPGDGYNLLTENEQDDLEDYGIDLFRDVGKETINEIGWTNYFEDLGRSLLSWGISVKGKDANGKKDYFSAELNEEDRIEQRELNEETTKLSTTLKQFGKKYEFNSRVRLRGVGLTAEDTFDKLQYKCSLKHFKILGIPIYKAEFEIKGDKEAELEFTKVHGGGIYSRLEFESDKAFNGIDRITYSFSKDNPYSNSRFGIHVGQDLDEGQTFAGISIMTEF
jgi:tRNA A37 threonylcarbamoyladenosine biosynthesis protein TsaE